VAACQAKLLLLPWAIALIFQWQSKFSAYPSCRPPFTDLQIDYCSTLFRPDMHINLPLDAKQHSMNQSINP